MIDLTVQSSIDELRERFDPKVVDRALRIAGRKTAMKARTYISKQVRSVWNIRAVDIAKTAKIENLGGKLAISLYYKGSRISLMSFNPKEIRNSKDGRAITTKRGKGGVFSKAAKRRSKKTGVTVKLRKGKKAERVFGSKRFGGSSDANGAFMARSKSQGYQVFARVGKRRTPLVMLTGPSIPQMVDSGQIMKNVFNFIEPIHNKEFNYALEKLLDGTIKNV